jgi:valyl-tRNA synthetase
MDQLAPQYNPKDVETKWFELWSKKPLLHARSGSGKKPYTIVIPPPNVTGILHMGHALNNTIQDILVRSKRMQGYEALWMPGTDHAGIATQNVVERQIAKEGLSRRDLGREKFLERVWTWKNQYGSTIIHQLKRIGAGCDWARERFTMDEGYSEAVKEVFVSLYEKGLIYQGDYIINWCPRCQTALADEEAPHHDLDGKLYYIKYALKKREEGRRNKEEKKSSRLHHSSSLDYLVVATTRPETMLGDTAVAIHPTDKRYKHLIGATLVLPLMEREIPVIADKLIDKKFGTGCVKVTPAHDPNDYAMGKSHDLPFINIMNPDGVLNAHAGEYAGMDRFEAREAIIEDLKERKLLVKIEDHKHAVGHCYRCHTVVEPYLSKQWFVRMKPLAQPAIKAVKKSEIKFTPKRWTKVYLNWMENIRDWCISRQIWWGHRLPVWYCEDCLKQSADHRPQTTVKKKNNVVRGSSSVVGVIVSRTTPERCPSCGGTDLKQDPDVLDTWFSSWLWPFATFGWSGQGTGCRVQGTEKNNQNPESRTLNPDLEVFYPTSVLVTAPEIIFFWVARMIMAGFEFMGKKPFSDVVIHGTVRDEVGRKMSKSLGNSIDPLEIVEQYGADALRFSLIASAASGSDIYLSSERFEQGRNFANKIWNASRFILMNLEDGVTGEAIDAAALKVQDLWILHELNEVSRRVKKTLDAYKFNEAVNDLFGFFWHDFCDWYLEIAKLDIKEKNTQEVLLRVLRNSMLLLHPFMPFITDEISGKLPGNSFETIALAPWPLIDKSFDNKEAAKSMRLVFDCVAHLRQRRHDLQVPPAAKINVVIHIADKKKAALIESVAPLIKRLAVIDRLEVSRADAVPQNTLPCAIDKDLKLFILLEGLVDVAEEKARLDKEIEEFKKQIKQKEGLLGNEGFAKRAPAEVVARERERLEELKAKLKNVTEIRHAFK